MFGVDRVTAVVAADRWSIPELSSSCCPSPTSTRSGVEPRELLAVVRRVSLMAQRNAPLRLRFEDGTGDALGPDAGRRRGLRDVPVNYQGEQLEIGFNPQFLQDGLESVESDERPDQADQPAAAGPARGGRRRR